MYKRKRTPQYIRHKKAVSIIKSGRLYAFILRGLIEMPCIVDSAWSWDTHRMK